MKKLLVTVLLSLPFLSFGMQSSLEETQKEKIRILQTQAIKLNEFLNCKDGQALKLELGIGTEWEETPSVQPEKRGHLTLYMWNGNDFIIPDGRYLGKPAQLYIAVPVYNNERYNEDFITSLLAAVRQLQKTNPAIHQHIMLGLDGDHMQATAEQLNIASILRKKVVPENCELTAIASKINIGPGEMRRILLKEIVENAEAGNEKFTTCFIDADDILHPNMFEVFLPYIQQNPYNSVTYGEYAARIFYSVEEIYEDRNTPRVKADFTLKEAVSDAAVVSYDKAYSNNGFRKEPGFYAFPPVFLHMDIIQMKQLIDKLTTNCEDTSMLDMCFYAKSSTSAAYLDHEKDRALYYYRQHRDSKSHSMTKKKLGDLSNAFANAYLPKVKKLLSYSFYQTDLVEFIGTHIDEEEYAQMRDIMRTILEIQKFYK